MYVCIDLSAYVCFPSLYFVLLLLSAFLLRMQNAVQKESETFTCALQSAATLLLCLALQMV